MHTVPTTLLYSLAGIPDLDWEKLIQLQCPDGSFLSSPSSTAFALMHTQDYNCLSYLANIVDKFNGGVPCVYPVDLFTRMWMIDRLKRLGISRYFEAQIKECVGYVNRYWTNEGIGAMRNCPVPDIDDTSMAFRTLRLHGYVVSADVFKTFEIEGKFFCYKGESNQSVTAMYNLYTTSQLIFPGEKILQDTKKFSSKFLEGKRAQNELMDKWIITKDLPGEVGYALDVPWYASLPRVEARFFLEQYGGDDDVWIGKTLYRWYKECELGEFGMNERSLLLTYYLASASIFEPQRSRERMAWVKTAVLMDTVRCHFGNKQLPVEYKTQFIHEFSHSCSSDFLNSRYSTERRLVGIILGTINQLSLGALLAHDTDIYHYLHHAWEKWLLTLGNGCDEVVEGEGAAELLIRTLNSCAGRWVLEELSRPSYQRLMGITNRVCHRLRLCQLYKVRSKRIRETSTPSVSF